MTALLAAIDLVIVAAVGVALAVTLGGGIALGPHTLRETSPWWHGAALLLLIRALALRGPAFASARAQALLARAAAAWVTATQRLSHRGALVPLVAVVAVAAKAMFIAAHPGFYSGDDFEPLQMARAWVDGVDVPVWDLRSPVHPAIAVAPFLSLLRIAGMDGPDAVLLSGRISGILFSTLNIFLVAMLARRILENRSAGDLAATLLAFSGLAVVFGTGAFPRAFSTSLVLSASLLFFDGPRAASGPLRLAGAGVILSAAFPIRFSEIIFLPAAVTVLWWERAHWKRIVSFLTGYAIGAAFLCGVVDALYWGRPFHSLYAAVDFTLVRGESTRGVQHVAWYLTELRTFLGVAALALIVAAHRAAPRSVLLWFWIPLLTLSLLPHKEERYLLPLLPFFAMALACGARRLAPALAVALLGIHLLAQWDAHLLFAGRDADDQLRAAQAIGPRARGRVLTDGEWEYAADLYLPKRRTLQKTSDLDDPEAEWIVARDDTFVRRPQLRFAARASGFVTVHRFGNVRALRRALSNSTTR